MNVKRRKRGRGLERTSRCDPFGWLTCNGRNSLKVFVVVKDGYAFGLSSRSDEQIGNRDASMVESTDMCETLLDFTCSTVGLAIHHGLLKAGKVKGAFVVFLCALGAEEHLQHNLIAHHYFVSHNELFPPGSDLSMPNPVPYTRVGEVPHGASGRAWRNTSSVKSNFSGSLN
jgi:hypothetical protein